MKYTCSCGIPVIYPGALTCSAVHICLDTGRRWGTKNTLPIFKRIKHYISWTLWGRRKFQESLEYD